LANIHPTAATPERIVRSSQRIAAQAGFAFPTHVLGLPYTPAEPPEFARFGKFALYARCAVDEALTREPHASASYRRVADPIGALLRGICEAELDGDGVLLSLKAISLGTLVSDILCASLVDQDAMRRLEFAASLHRFIAGAYLDIARELRNAGHLDAALKALDRSGDQQSIALTFVDAMRELNEPMAAA
jgi:hypothetical protein